MASRLRLAPVARHGAASAAVLGLALLVSALFAGHGETAEKKATEVLNAVVGVRADVPLNARTAESLGVVREGSGVVIDEDGLVLTIGYLILEAGITEIIGADDEPVPADIVAYDHETGFGLLRALQPLDAKPMALGESAALGARDEVLVASHVEMRAVQPAVVVARREFAGYWEYLLPGAIFTSPPHEGFGGAALIGRDGRLLGIGSLVVGDTIGNGTVMPGNMFIPIDLLKPILPELLKTGRTAQPSRPWLGLFAEELKDHVIVTAVAEGGPAAGAGISPGDLIIGVAGAPVNGLADFYRKVWALGEAGTDVPLLVGRASGTSEITVTSGDRYAWLRLDPTY
ncbi:S1C family serine protease [Rhodospirillaceae bacterium SYSU D60014]|uniref:S1C family serine protease n=1 Tax=Virgifigura deserti TaxID=2268457 RepID=UPI000E67479D